MAELTELTSRALAEISASADVSRLDEVRVHWLGKKGVLTEQLKSLGAMPDGKGPGRDVSAQACGGGRGPAARFGIVW